ncbi:hypothetical protein, partial [Entomohabitans teleogrylli]|uniref:hypothetical protein n=1 Tax=Entomohabitans teleogrylli TaxID=1384589 RepID=UPI003B82DA1E
MKITRVAPGRLADDSTDAVNGSQLHDTNTALDKLASTPLTFAGNTGQVGKLLGEKLTVKGGAATTGLYSDANINTLVDDNGNLVIQMAENPEFTSVKTGNTTINNNG